MFLLQRKLHTLTPQTLSSYLLETDDFLFFSNKNGSFKICGFYMVVYSS